MTLKPMGNERAQNVRASFFFVEHTILNIEKVMVKILRFVAYFRHFVSYVSFLVSFLDLYWTYNIQPALLMVYNKRSGPLLHARPIIDLKLYYILNIYLLVCYLCTNSCYKNCCFLLYSLAQF